MSFQNAHNFSIDRSNFYDIGGNQYITTSNSGHDILRTNSARGAAYNSVERYPPPECVDGTRQDVKDTIVQWIFSPEGRPICWIHGLAGSGKSAIAQSLAQICADRKVLAASFFFSRGNVERSTSQRLFTTISYQFTISYPELKTPIHQALHDDPSIPDRIFRDQLQYLIIDPLLSLRESDPPRRIIVIDALDECGDPQAAQEVIVTLANALRQHQSLLQVIITSRPEFYIQVKFRLRQISLMTHAIDLRLFDAHDDIRIFLTRRLQEILDTNSDVMDPMADSWPSTRDLEKLVEESSGLFIFAATILKFIDNPYRHPDHSLAVVLRRTHESPSGSSPHAGLDELYKQVLSTTPYNGTRLVLGVIVLLFDPLSIGDLGDLLSLGFGQVRVALRGLHSVLFIPEGDEQPVRTFHESLRDFLLDDQRSSVYCINHTEHHAIITRYCLQLMTRALERDICKIADFSKLNCEVLDLPKRCDMYISGALRYACHYWAHHLSEASDGSLALEINTFVTKSLLYWIETLSVLGNLDTAIPTLQRAQQWLKNFPDPSNDLPKLLYDAERFTLKFFDPICAAALHVYYSALPFTPNETRLRQLYSHEMATSVEVLSDMYEEWDTRLRTIICQERMVSIAFSPDGVLIASGSMFGTLYIWDAVTGGPITVLKTSTESHVDVFAFSPTGNIVAIGGWKWTGGLSLLDITTGNSVTLGDDQMHPYSVLFLPDGTRIASIWSNNTLQIWDTTHHHLISEFLGQYACCFLSINDSLLSYRYKDGELVLWNIVTGQVIAKLSGDELFWPFAASSDGAWVASRANYRLSNVSVWKSSGGDFQLQCELESTECLDGRLPLVLSPTGTLVACAYEGLDILCLWDAITGQRFHDVCDAQYGWHTHNTFRFSPNGSQIAACGDSDVIELWNLPEENKAYRPVPRPIMRKFSPHWKSSTRDMLVSASHIISVNHTRDSMHLDGPLAIEITDRATSHIRDVKRSAPNQLFATSPSGAHLAWRTGPYFDLAIEIWDVVTNKLLSTIRDEQAVRHGEYISFSKTGDFVAIFSPNCPAELGLWDAKTGGHIRTLGTSSVYSFSDSVAVFSNSESRIAWMGMRSLDSASDFVLWDARTGDLVTGNTEAVCSSSEAPFHRWGKGAFSPDDRLVAFGFQNSGISLWDTGNGQCLTVLPAEHEWPYRWANKPLVFHADGAHAYLISIYTKIQIPAGLISSSTLLAMQRNSHHCYHVQRDGWVFDGMKRVCWVPAEYRPQPDYVQSSRGHILAAFLGEHDKVTLDFSNICNPCPHRIAVSI